MTNEHDTTIQMLKTCTGDYPEKQGHINLLLTDHARLEAIVAKQTPCQAVTAAAARLDKAYCSWCKSEEETDDDNEPPFNYEADSVVCRLAYFQQTVREASKDDNTKYSRFNIK